MKLQLYDLSGANPRKVNVSLSYQAGSTNESSTVLYMVIVQNVSRRL